MAMEVFFRSLTLVSGLAQALVYGLGGYLAVRGRLDPGTVVTMALLLNRLYGPLTALGTARLDVVTALVSFERVFEVLDIEPLIAEPAEPRGRCRRGRSPSSWPASGSPTRRPTGCRWHRWRRSPCSTTGPATRCSTTSRSASNPARPSPWSARRAPASRRSPRSCRGCTTPTRARCACPASTCATCRSTRSARTVGVVTQDGHLFHDTIRANLRYAAPDASDAELWAALEQARLADLVRSLADGLDTVVGERGYRLSGGERQRLTIARLLLAKPRVVILDEATAHLDSQSEVAVQEALRPPSTGARRSSSPTACRRSGPPTRSS